MLIQNKPVQARRGPMLSRYIAGIVVMITSSNLIINLTREILFQSCYHLMNYKHEVDLSICKLKSLFIA